MSKKKVTSEINGDIKYQFKTKEGVVTISFDDEVESSKFKIQGPKSIIGKAIGGVGDENETEAWATEENLKTEAQRMYVVLEVMKILYEK